MPAEIMTGLSAFKALYDSAKALKDMNDAAVRNAAVIELQEKILAAQMAQSDLIQSIRESEEEVRELKAWKGQKDRYELKSLGFGAFAYMLKPAVRGIEPPHWVCTNCFGKDQISIIQYSFLDKQGFRHHCPACKAQINPAPNYMNGNEAKWLDENS